MKIQLDKTLPLKVSGGFILMDKIGINSSHNLFLFKTSGFSMWPFLRGGQKIIIKKVLVRDLKVGDLILYRKDNQTICHRLIKKTREGQGQMLYVRGDNAFGFEPVAEEMVLGKAVGIVKNNKTSDFTTKKQRFINRLIVIISPWVRRGTKIIKPLYNRFRKIIDFINRKNQW